MLQKVEYAKQQAREAQQAAQQCAEGRARQEWLNAARMWDALADEYERIARTGELEIPPHN